MFMVMTNVNTKFSSAKEQFNCRYLKSEQGKGHANALVNFVKKMPAFEDGEKI